MTNNNVKLAIYPIFPMVSTIYVCSLNKILFQAEKVDKHSETEKAVIEVEKKINEIQPHVKQLSSDVEKVSLNSQVTRIELDI